MIPERTERRPHSGCAIPAPSKPIGLHVAHINATDASVVWEEPSTVIEGYEISVSPSGSKNLNWISLAKHVPEYNMSDLRVNAEYTVRLIAYTIDENGQKLKSATAAVDFSTGEYSDRV